MKNNASVAYSFILIIGDFLALLAAFSVAYILRVKFDTRPLIEQIPALDFFYAFATVLPLWILVNAFIGLYNQDVYEKRFSELGRLLVGSFIGILVVIGYDFITVNSLFPARLIAVYGLALGFGFLVLFRSFARLLRQLLFKLNFGISNILIVGNTAASEDIARAIANTKQTGLRVLGIVGKKTNRYTYFSSFEQAIEQLEELPHGIIHTELYKDQDKNNAILTFAQEHHVSYRFMPGNGDLFVGNITVDLFAGLPVIAVHQTSLIGWGRIVKRLFDIFVSLILLILLSPILILVVLFMWLFDRRGPIMFKQSRLTRFNREFKCYKFRTMKSKYNDMTPEKAFDLMNKPELATKYRDNGDFLSNDPRISYFGRFLRLTSLDELPQLLNVLKGDISLVGPRALIPQELNSYEKKHAILSVKSGMTGLAQISGRRDISFDERRKLDVYYVQNWSFSLDIIILLRTLRAVINGIGAK